MKCSGNLVDTTINKMKGTPGAAAFSEYLKKVLHEHNVEFTVAPYSALAQVSPPKLSLRSVHNIE